MATIPNLINPFLTNVSILYPLKTNINLNPFPANIPISLSPENTKKPLVGILARNGLRSMLALCRNHSNQLSSRHLPVQS